MHIVVNYVGADGVAARWSGEMASSSCEDGMFYVEDTEGLTLFVCPYHRLAAAYTVDPGLVEPAVH